MRRSLLLLSLAACGSPDTVPPKPAPPAPSAVSDSMFHADSLGVDKHYLVYLPAGYDADPARRWPVVYMLNGLGGNERNWWELGKLPAAADAIGLEAIVISVDGDSSFYANWVTPPPSYDDCAKVPPPFQPTEDGDRYCVREARYEDYVTRDLIAHVDATYRTIPERSGRAIGGLSMGGFGALQLAMRHPDLYASAASHSGVDALLYAGPHPYVSGQAVIADDVSHWGAAVEPIGEWVRRILGPDLANWQAHDPASLAATMSDGDLAIYLDCGTEDEFVLHDGAAYLHDLLTERGIAHEYFTGPGHHDFTFWAERIDDSLAFHAAQFAKLSEK